MSTPTQDIISQIDAHILLDGGPITQWYVGITDNARYKLFTTHNVDQQNGWWIYRTAISTEDANEVCRQLVTAGAKNSKSMDDINGTVVYAFKITETTKY